jgi:hypothetical protein
LKTGFLTIFFKIFIEVHSPKIGKPNNLKFSVIKKTKGHKQYNQNRPRLAMPMGLGMRLLKINLGTVMPLLEFEKNNPFIYSFRMKRIQNTKTMPIYW